MPMRCTLNLQFPLGHRAHLCSREPKDEESSLRTCCKMEFDSITLLQPVCPTAILKKQSNFVSGGIWRPRWRHLRFPDGTGLSLVLGLAVHCTETAPLMFPEVIEQASRNPA
ncbi:LOW QUALITY PROTEIN: hypothetical protein, conserved [Eimeria necatrix]|uniref:Uncharacterized protein n=1 Tax=Eimeria necatrix TaxID=51315 RepID=U6MT02_9EIME|nr:LOW QUALITY PROTEIN: hypothetical protein, conserved [Eimeria necatrix]CDJ64795.1 hypothetical protein, conserved [Eimeria necatrix]